MIFLTIILFILTSVLFVISLTVKGWKRYISIAVFIVLIAVHVTNEILSWERESARNNQIKQLKIELEEEKKRVKPVSLDLFGYEIKGTKIGAQMHMLHEAVQSVKPIIGLIYKKHYEEADKLCDSLIADFPTFAGAYFWKGTIALIKGDESKSEHLWTKATEIEPENISYSLLYRNLGILRMKMDRTEGAIVAFRIALNVALSTEEMRKAEKEQGKRPITRISTDECYFFIAKAYEKGGNIDSLRYYRNKAIDLNTEWKEIWNDSIMIIIP